MYFRKRRKEDSKTVTLESKKRKFYMILSTVIGFVFMLLGGFLLYINPLPNSYLENTQYDYTYEYYKDFSRDEKNQVILGYVFISIGTLFATIGPCVPLFLKKKNKDDFDYDLSTINNTSLINTLEPEVDKSDILYYRSKTIMLFIIGTQILKLAWNLWTTTMSGTLFASIIFRFALVQVLFYGEEWERPVFVGYSFLAFYDLYQFILFVIFTYFYK